MEDWNEDDLSFELNLRPQHEFMNDLDNFNQPLDTFHNIQQPSNMIFQTFHDENSNFDSLSVPNSTCISDFIMNENPENILSSNSSIVTELPPMETPMWQPSSTISNGNFSQLPNFSTQTSFSNENNYETATEAFLQVDSFEKENDDYTLNSIVKPRRTNGGEGGYGGNSTNYYPTSFETPMMNIKINSQQNEIPEVPRNNGSSFQNPNYLYHASGQNHCWGRDEEGNQSSLPMQPPTPPNHTNYPQSPGNRSIIGQTNSNLSYQNSSFGYSNSTNYASLPQSVGGSSIIRQANTSLTYPNSLVGHSNSTNNASSPQSLGGRSITQQANSSLTYPNSSVGYDNSTNYASLPQYLGRTSIIRQANSSLTYPNSSVGSLSEYSTRTASGISRPTAHDILKDGKLSQIRNESISKGSKTQQTNPIASFIITDDGWWRKKNSITQLVFNQVFEMRNSRYKKNEEVNTTQTKNHYLGGESDDLVTKDAAINPTTNQPFLGDISYESGGIVMR